MKLCSSADGRESDGDPRCVLREYTEECWWKQQAILSLVHVFDCYMYIFYRSIINSQLDATSPAPIRRLPLQEGSYRTKIAFVSKEICLLQALTPELDGEGQRVDGLLVPADEGATEVDMGKGVDAALEVGDLANVITV